MTHLPPSPRRRSAARRHGLAVAAFSVVAFAVASPSVAGDVGSPTDPPADRVVTTISQADGAILISTAEVGTLSISDCRSGYTCVWSSSLYTGTLVQYRLRVDEDEFAAMYADLYPVVLGYAARRTDWHVAEDIAAQALAIAWHRGDVLPLERDERCAWLIVVARNLLANSQRARMRATT